MRITGVIAGVLLCVTAAGPALLAQGRGQGQGQGQSQGRRGSGSGGGDTNVSISATVVFGNDHRSQFGDYFQRHRIVGKPLPPGIAKNVARGKPLPPGIAKQALPTDLVTLVMRDTRIPRDTTFAIVGNVVVAQRRGVVVDVMTGVFR